MARQLHRSSHVPGSFRFTQGDDGRHLKILRECTDIGHKMRCTVLTIFRQIPFPNGRIRIWRPSAAPVWFLFAALFLFPSPVIEAQPATSSVREFAPGILNRVDQLPVTRFRERIAQLPPSAQLRALHWLRSFHFTELDIASLHTDAEGAIYYADEFEEVGIAESQTESESPGIGEAATPVDPFPASLVFHSKPGAPNVLYLNFVGEAVSGTAWNTSLGRAVIPATAFSADSDYTMFSDADQTIIKRVWQRVAEDYAAFDIDVTTERPAVFGSRTAHLLITRSTDANGAANPSSGAGGVAYVNVFGTTSYATYRPAWVYFNNFGNNESFIAEAASHEVGHNLGLSHDGTSSSSYYGGHGSGDISWGPLMGTGYNRNVSQWSKGDYYLANNTQDDLATIAAKISYRSDDHGNTPGTATTLTVTGGTNIVSTTPENDPENLNRSNKGILERAADVDVFSFVTGTGAVSLSVKPWTMPAGTRGGNSDLRIELHNDSGVVLLTSNPDLQTSSQIQTNLAQGRYYLYVRNSGAGDPMSSTPSGYTPYGSIGQFFISGYVVAASGFVSPPVAELAVTDLTQSGQNFKSFAVTYSDDLGISIGTIGSDDIRVTGPDGYDRLAQLASVNSPMDGTPRIATYTVSSASGGVWSPLDNGIYTISMETNQVSDTEGAWVGAGPLGQFKVVVPVAMYSVDMNVNPGWTLEPDWQYGTPSYTVGTGPMSGFTGTKIIGYNLSGSYPNRLDMKYATTPVINCSGSSSVILRFHRWLRTRSSDNAVVEVSTNGMNWMNVWSSSGGVSDTSWEEVQYTLPAGVAGSPTVRLRWGLASNPAQNDIGWNIDDVELLGDGSFDTAPPVPMLTITDIINGGSPSH
jgi:hypothetical protein